MKYFTFIITIAILSSCGIYNSKIAHLRYVKVDNQDVAILEKSSNKEIKEQLMKEVVEANTIQDWGKLMEKICKL